MLKVEGENRIDVESVVNEIAKKYGVTDKQALKFFCTAIKYEFVMNAIFEQIDFLLEAGKILKERK